LNEKLGSDKVHFYPGVGYRHICKIKEGKMSCWPSVLHRMIFTIRI
jgi:hypothetical protein